VLDAIYAAFAEGWTDPAGTDVSRRNLTEETLFLARLVMELLPAEAEALGLLALMLQAEARRFARRTSTGEYVPLAKQDLRLWDSEMIREAGGVVAAGEQDGLDWTISIGGRAPVRSRLSLPNGALQLEGNCAALRRAAGNFGIASGCN